MIQLVVCKKIDASIYFEPRRKPGDVVWVNNEKIARELIESGLCKLLQIPDGHKEPPDEKKFAGEATLGLSIASPLSTRSGPERLSSRSAAALVSRRRL